MEVIGLADEESALFLVIMAVVLLPSMVTTVFVLYIQVCSLLTSQLCFSTKVIFTPHVPVYIWPTSIDIELKFCTFS